MPLKHWQMNMAGHIANDKEKQVGMVELRTTMIYPGNYDITQSAAKWHEAWRYRRAFRGAYTLQCVGMVELSLSRYYCNN
jgi:hypothetical protein